jgi:hypothetical protein
MEVKAVIHQLPAGRHGATKKAAQCAGPQPPFHASPPRPASWRSCPTGRATLTVMALNLLWIANLTYIYLISRHRPALTREHTFQRGLLVRQPRVLRAAKSAGLKPRPSRRTIAYDNALRESPSGTLNNTSCSATSITLLTADPPPQHLYSRRFTAAGGMRPFAPPH